MTLTLDGAPILTPHPELLYRLPEPYLLACHRPIHPVPDEDQYYWYQASRHNTPEVQRTIRILADMTMRPSPDRLTWVLGQTLMFTAILGPWLIDRVSTVSEDEVGSAVAGLLCVTLGAWFLSGAFFHFSSLRPDVKARRKCAYVTAAVTTVDCGARMLLFGWSGLWYEALRLGCVLYLGLLVGGEYGNSFKPEEVEPPRAPNGFIQPYDWQPMLDRRAAKEALKKEKAKLDV